MRGLLIGRWQPPHLGHLKVIQHILEEVDELVIVIAAAQSSFSIKNSFTAGERLTMLRSMLIQNRVDITKIWLIPAQDVYDNDIWVHHILRLIPKVDRIFGNNPFIKLLWGRFGYNVEPTPLFEREKFEGRQVREGIANNDDMEEILDKTVIQFLKEIDASTRLQAIYGTDSKSSNEPTSNITK